ncbi:MAG: AAA family ATPase [Devosia sp.]|uniref:AAA family ATPase n=1 Tax=Devosia sp. TaxID=1871048 RepID=UPI0019E3E468|nr:AAA family ATPase [Devosia sp.]MBF0680827.1 AAA family ATPase [Devosia sp.]
MDNNEAPQFQDIPNELKTLRQWVVWKAITEDGRTTKQPLCPNALYPANVTNPGDWGSFDDAVKAMNDNPSVVAGIGFVFTADDEYFGIDLDDESKVASQDLVRRQKLVDQVMRNTTSYAEVSPSGKGIHIIARGRLSSDCRHRNVRLQIEIYDQRRFFTMTGNLIQARRSITDEQEAADKLSAAMGGDHSSASIGVDLEPTTNGFRRLDMLDAEVIEFANDNIFGFLERYSFVNVKDWSEAHRDLLGDLDKVSGDPEQVQRIVHSSPLVLLAPSKAGETRLSKSQRIFAEELAGVRARYERMEFPYQVNPYFKAHGRQLAARLRVSPTPRNTSLIRSSGDFVRDFTPPDYLIDGIIQLGFFYSLTGQTGSGKTCVALLIAAQVSLGLELAGREIAKGRVLYLAGENPDDVRMRWIGLCTTLGVEPKDMNVHFVPGVFSIKELGEQVAAEVQTLGGVSLVVIDTTAAYFEGDDENNNVEAVRYARLLRGLTQMPGRPAVIAASHPVKNAHADNLVPRGGGAFLNEVDGNLSLAKRGPRLSELHTQGKFRGPDFESITFGMQTIHPPQLIDSRGRNIPTVRAQVVSDVTVENRMQKTEDDDRAVLRMIKENGTRSQAEMATIASWTKADLSADKDRVTRAIIRLKKQSLVEYSLGIWALTAKGKRTLPYTNLIPSTDAHTGA